MTILTIYFIGFILTLFLAVRGGCALFSSRSRAAIVRHPLGHGAIFAVVLFIWFAPWGGPLGTLQAASDDRAGVFRLYAVALQGSRQSRAALSEVLWEKHQIHHVPFRGCFGPSKNEWRYERAYDRAMLPALQARFGPDFLKICLAEAEQRAAREEKTPLAARAAPGR